MVDQLVPIGRTEESVTRAQRNGKPDIAGFEPTGKGSTHSRGVPRAGLDDNDSARLRPEVDHLVGSRRLSRGYAARREEQCPQREAGESEAGESVMPRCAHHEGVRDSR